MRTTHDRKLMIESKDTKFQLGIQCNAHQTILKYQTETRPLAGACPLPPGDPTDHHGTQPSPLTFCNPFVSVNNTQRNSLLRNPLAMAVWESGRWSSLSFLSSIANSWCCPQPCSKTLSGTCPPSLTLLLGDSIELHGKPSFPPSCEPSQNPLLDQPHSFESVPRNTLYPGLPVTTLVRNSEPLPTRQPIASHYTFLKSREGSGNPETKDSTR